MVKWFAPISLLLVLALVVPPAEQDAVAQAQEPGPPNLVVIMTDDQTVESLRLMPRVRRRLTDRGVRFSNSFVSYPLCCPSRATALTGQYSHNNGVRFNTAPAGGYQSFRDVADSALPVALQGAGYHTAHFGKVMNEYGMEDSTEVPPGWDTWHALLDKPVRNRYYGFTVNVDGQTKRLPATAENYNTDYFAREAKRYINSRATTAEPFFLNLWLFGPHGETGNGPTIPAERHIGRLSDLTPPHPPSMAETDMRDKPLHLQRPPLSRFQRRRATWAYRWRAEALLAVDEAVADVTTALSRTGQLDNTVIVFTSDNGFYHGEHGIPRGKWHAYDEATRVPLIIRGPGVPAGVTRSTPVANIDLLPTLLSYAGAEPLNVPDGRPLQPLISGELTTFGRDLLITTGYGRARRWYTAIRTDRWLYVEHVQDAAAEEIIAEELYNLRRDPWQLNSLHDDPDREALRARLQSYLHRLRTCAGTSCHSRAQMPPSGDGGEPVPPSEVNTSGPVDDPESYPEFFSLYDEDARAAAAVEPTGTAVTLTTNRATIAGTRDVAFTSTVTHDDLPAPGVTVTLRRRQLGTEAWTDVATATTDAAGEVTIRHPVSAGAVWRAHVLSQPTSSWGRSSSRRVQVKPKLGPSMRWNRAGTALLFEGRVDPARPGHLVQLLHHDGKRWTVAASTQLSRRSEYDFRVGRRKVHTRYRIRMPATLTTLAEETRTLRPA